MSKKVAIPVFNTPIIETHCHLDYLLKQECSIDEVVKAAQAVNIERIITIGVSPDNLDPVVEIAQAYDCVWGTQGIHPHDAKDYSSEVEQQIRVNALKPKMVAIGEIGLDYFYDHSDRKVQRAVFESQLQIAIDLDLPIVVHTREADEDMAAILKNFIPQMKQRGVIHSFTSGQALAEYCLSEGFCLGFNGISTFKPAENVREIIALTPFDNILLETDAPYLTPVPYRGQKNEPKYLPFIAQQVATVKGIEVEALLPQVRANSMRVFWANP
jgi:TatD DNase family protein